MQVYDPALDLETHDLHTAIRHELGPQQISNAASKPTSQMQCRFCRAKQQMHATHALLGHNMLHTFWL